MKNKLQSIIQPIETSKHTEEIQWSSIERWIKSQDEDGGFNDNPDYQRDHVWTKEQQISFIEGVIRGIIPQSLLSIRINNPLFEQKVLNEWSKGAEWKTICELPFEVQVIDGKQRLNAIRQFLSGNIKIFNEQICADDLKSSPYSPFSKRIQLNIMNFTKKDDLLKFYLALNSGGTVHSQADLDKVKNMLS